MNRGLLGGSIIESVKGYNKGRVVHWFECVTKEQGLARGCA